MFAGLMANFTGEIFYTQPPQPTAAGAPDSDVLAGLTQLYKKIIELGYALEVKVSSEGALSAQDYLQEAGVLKSFAANYGASGAVLDALKGTAGTRVSFTLKAPATLWGRQWLGMQEYLHTDHDLMIAMAYLRKCGRAATVHSKVDSNSFTREFVLL